MKRTMAHVEMAAKDLKVLRRRYTGRVIAPDQLGAITLGRKLFYDRAAVSTATGKVSLSLSDPCKIPDILAAWCTSEDEARAWAPNVWSRHSTLLPQYWKSATGLVLEMQLRNVANVLEAHLYGAVSEIVRRMECPPNMILGSARDVHFVYNFNREVTRADQPRTPPLHANGTLFRAHVGVGWDVFRNCQAVWADGNECQEEGLLDDSHDGPHIAVLLRGTSLMSSLFTPPLSRPPIVSGCGPYDPDELAALCPTSGGLAALRNPTQLVFDFIRVLGRSLEQGLGRLLTYESKGHSTTGRGPSRENSNVIGVAYPKARTLVIYAKRALASMELAEPMIGGMLSVEPSVIMKCLSEANAIKYSLAGGASDSAGESHRNSDDEWVLCGRRMLAIAKIGRKTSTVAREKEEFNQAIRLIERALNEHAE